MTFFVTEAPFSISVFLTLFQIVILSLFLSVYLFIYLSLYLFLTHPLSFFFSFSPSLFLSLLLPPFQTYETDDQTSSVVALQVSTD